ncbi:MAG: hypothetical protein QXE38_04110 [Candidatus Methanomethylicia archaeon]
MNGSELEVIIRNIKDEYWKHTEEGGFEVYTMDKEPKMHYVIGTFKIFQL